MKLENPYTLEDAGCYADGTLGATYVDQQAVNIATDHGATIDITDDEFLDEAGDEASDYMNETCPVDGAFWGYQDGDWGLWLAQDED